MEFITAPLIVWICVSGVYGLFELFARREERKAIIEKTGVIPNSPHLDRNFSLLNFSAKSFTSLKTGCLLVGLGLGLLVGLLIQTVLLSNNYYAGTNQWIIEKHTGIAYGASVLLFGGIGLLVSFILENRMNKEK